eukprot:356609-Chlamydomonas_euryale.AAC.2
MRIQSASLMWSCIHNCQIHLWKGLMRRWDAAPPHSMPQWLDASLNVAPPCLRTSRASNASSCLAYLASSSLPRAA